MKLNLGCGKDHLPGWVNVDKFPEAAPDVAHDLERFPWPFADGCATEVLLKHVLEHLGKDADSFLGILRELYRVCAPDALVRIAVPHPRHRDFLQDPTHVRPVLAEMFEHFSLDINDQWVRRGQPGTPLALYLGIDFAIEKVTLMLDPWWDAEYRSGRVSKDQLDRAARDLNNVIQATEIELRARKPFRGKAPVAATAKLPVRWEGTQFRHHSLAHVNRQLCLGLLRSGRVDLGIAPYEPDTFDGAAVPAFQPLAAVSGKAPGAPAAVHVRHQWPPSFQPPAEGAWVMIQPWEYGGIPQEWLAPMRDLVDEVWVPSTWLKDCYVKSGVPADQVVVVPNGVDGAVFRPEGVRFPLATGKGCRFLFVGGGIHRKGIDLLLEAYRRSFRRSDDVCLVIKEQGGGIYAGDGLGETLAKLRREDPELPEIEYRNDDLGEPEIAALYRSCDLLVLPYRGEGFGLPIAEAMASGLPVLVTGRGAARDFTQEDWAYLIPSHTIPVSGQPGLTPGQAGFWLEEPNLDALAGLLRRAYEHPEERRAMGARARDYALAELGWDKPVALALERLQALAGRVPRRLGAPAAAPGPGPEAFLYRPDWTRVEWAEVLLSFLLAFKAGEPVALVLPWTGVAGEPTLESVQTRIVTLAKGAGIEAFPDIVLVDQPEELPEVLAGYPRVTEVPHGRAAVDGLVSALGQRLAAARTRLAAAQ
jgi:glycosyltransferase involved in cell wall biosynthesis